MELSGKTALITGAGSGIGRATALMMAAAGADIAALSNDADEVNAVVAEIEKLGRKVIGLTADVSSDADMSEAFARTKESFGTLDILFSNAGINGVWAPIEDMQCSEWDQNFAVNMRGSFLSVHYAIPLMKENGGAIVITSSVNGNRIYTSAGASAYASAKAGQVAFTKMAALELARYKIRVNAVCPGWVKTGIGKNTVHRNVEKIRVPAEYPEGKIPLTGGEAGTAEDVAEMVLFLASDRAKHISGTPVFIDGAESLLV